MIISKLLTVFGVEWKAGMELEGYILFFVIIAAIKAL